MKSFRILILATALAMGCIGTMASRVGAQTPASAEAQKAASELFSLVFTSMISDVIAKTVNVAWPPIESALLTRNPKPDAAAIAELRKEFERQMFNAMNEIMNGAPDLYARHFTAQEMRDMVAFYRTPSGAKALKTMPQVTLELTTSMAPRLQGLQEKVNLAFLNILQKRGFYGQ